MEVYVAVIVLTLHAPALLVGLGLTVKQVGGYSYGAADGVVYFSGLCGCDNPNAAAAL